ncbi:MAG: hypothetical protein AB1467_01570 [Candidatus Diapherotrites archaeon]
MSFPLDFPDRSYRNKKNFENILRALNFYKPVKKRPIICIGTVVTRDNFNKLQEIGRLLENYPIDVWKLYQFTPTGGNAKKNRGKLEITKTLFNQATKNLKCLFSNHFKVIISPARERSKAYFLIKPDGVVFTPIKENNSFGEIKIGNIFDKDIEEKWSKAKVSGNYLKKIECFNQQFFKSKNQNSKNTLNY